MRETDTASDIWTRLAILDRCCTLKLESIYSSTDPVHAVLLWRCTIARKDGVGSPIVTEGTTAREVLKNALERAERDGWHRL